MPEIFAQIQKWLSPPRFEDDDDKTRKAYLLNITLLSFVVIGAIIFVLWLISKSSPPSSLLVSAVFLMACLGLKQLMRRGHVYLAAAIFCVMLYTGLTLGTVMMGTVKVPTTAFYGLLIAAAGLLIGPRTMLGITALNILTVVALSLAEQQGWLPAKVLYAGHTAWVVYSASFVITAILLYLATKSIDEAMQRANQSLAERSRAETEIRRLNAELEATVARRTAELTASEERYRLIAENASDVIWTIDFGLNLTYISPSVARVTGHTPEELINKPVQGFLTEASFSRALEIFSQEMTRGVALSDPNYTVTIEMEHICKDGSIYRNEVKAGVFHNTQGQPVGILGVGRDISERKKAEAALLESENKFRSFFNSSLDAMFLTDKQGSIVEWNQASEKLTGLSRASLLGTPVWEMQIAMTIPEQKQGELLEKLRTRLQTNIMASTQSGQAPWLNHITSGEMQTPDGERKYFQQALFTIPIGDGFRLAGITRDVTVAKRTEMREQARREMMEKVIDLGKVVTQITDPRLCQMKIRQSILQELGFDRVGIFLYDEKNNLIQGTYGTNKQGQLEDTSWYREVVKPDSTWMRVLNSVSGAYVVEHYDQVYDPSQYEGDMLGVDQHVTVAAWAGEKPVGFLAADNLLTGRRFTPEQIEGLQLFAGYAGLAIQNSHWNEELEKRVTERTAALGSANQELESLSYTIAHDMRSPVRAMVGFTQLLQEGYGRQMDPEGQADLQRIHEAALSMGKQVDDFLTYLRLGRSPLHKEPVTTADLLRQVVKNLMAASQGRQIEFVYGDLPPCEADAKMLEQVWRHLVSNAIKFTRPRPVARITLGAEVRDGQPVYFVRDNGIGFESKYAERIFGVFQYLNRKDEFEGTGMGLAIAQRIIQRHGGRIWAEAEMNKGATFYFTVG